MREPKTILLTDSGSDNLEDFILELQDAIASKGWCIGSRSCGVTKDIQMGDRIFLLLQGRQRPGIIASGWALCEPYEDVHWKNPEKFANYILCTFDHVINPFRQMHLERKVLLEGPLGTVRWNTQSSGISVNPEAAALLEQRWSEFCGRTLTRPADEDLLGILKRFVNEPPDKVEINTLRFLRDRSLADQIKEIYHFECQRCQHVIENSSGERYAETAHIKPLKFGGLDVEENMICLCPNCHKEMDMGCWFLDPFNLQYVEGHVLGPEFIDFYNTSIYINADSDDTDIAII